MSIPRLRLFRWYFSPWRWGIPKGLRPARIAAFLGLIWHLVLVSAQAQFCLTWVQRGNAVAVNPVGTPGQRAHHAMAYDSKRGVTVFFGGEIGKTGSEAYFNDTWEYDGNQWHLITIVGDIPPARSLHSMAYDPVSKRVLMYGGFAGGEYGLDDTWAYQGNGFSGTWTHLAGSASDTGVAGPGLVWTPFLGRVIRVGGVEIPYEPSSIGTRFNGLDVPYYWTGSAWAPDPNPGPEVWGFGLAYDSYRNVAVLVGGYDGWLGDSATQTPNKMWEFQLNVGWTNTASNFPGRGFPAMAYDDRRHRFVVVGGDNGQAATEGQTYEFDSLHPENGWMLGVALPSGMGRAGAAMVYDSKRGVMVIMGGAGPGAPNSNDGGRYDDTWELVSAPPPLVIAGPVDTNIFCTTEPFSGLRIYSGGSLPLFNYQWMVDGASLVDQTNYALELPANSLIAGNHMFTVSATDQCGNPLSTNASYTFHQPPVIQNVNVQNSLGTGLGPGSLIVTNYQCPGGSITFSAEMRVDPLSLPTTYQWYHNGIELKDATNGSLTVTNLRHEDTGQYNVVASNFCGPTDSSAFSPVYLQVGVTIDSQPIDSSGQVCQSTEFLVQATGFGELQYQWRLDGVPLQPEAHFSGIKTNKLIVGPLLYAHEGDYDVVITDNCGAANSVTSHIAQLTLRPGPQWVLRTTNGPQARFANAMAYDSARGVTVMYGGGQVVPNVGYVGFGEVWEWNGAHWRQRTTYNASNVWHQVTGGYWRQNFTDTPASRVQHAMAYDSRRKRVVMFGGRGAGPDNGDYMFGDTWEWDGSRWYFRATNGPPAQFDHHMAYDPKRAVTVLYGGFGASVGGVWEWDGNQWNSVTPTKGPATNYYQDAGAMDFDPSTGLIFFGPATDGFSLSFYFYWNGRDWIDAGTGFGMFNRSPPYGAMVFDTYRRRSLLFGGEDNGFDAYEGGSTAAVYDPRRGWSVMPDAKTLSQFADSDFPDPPGLAARLVAHSDLVSEFIWTNLSTTTQGTLADSSTPVSEQALVLANVFNGVIGGASIYDPARFAGVALSTETMLFRNINPVGVDVPRFNRLLLEDTYPLQIRRGPSIPTGRWRHAMAFDSARHAAVLMGGTYAYPNLVGNETWELLDVDMPLINEQPATQYRAPGDTAVFNVAAVGPPGLPLTFQWFYGAEPLNDDTRISGSQSPTLHIANIKTTDAGQYQVRVSDNCGNVYSSPAMLTTDPSFQIFSSANTLTLVWSAPNTVLQEADAITGPWSPVPGAASPFDITAAGPGKFFRLVSGTP